MTDITLRRTAWHEAGHAVVAWDQGFTVTLVSIRRIGDGFGRCQFTPAADCSVLSERTRENIVAMGGWAAEHASGESNNGETYDSADLTCILSRVEESQIAIELGWAEREAERIVSANRARVERLATELLSRIELDDAAEILKIIEGP